MGKKKRWVRLRRALQKLKLIDVPVPKGDGGFISDQVMGVIGGKSQRDSTLIVKDTVVVAYPKN